MWRSVDMCAVLLSCSQGQDVEESLLQLTERDCRILLSVYHNRLNAASTDEKKEAVMDKYQPLLDKGVYHRKRRASSLHPCTCVHPHFKNTLNGACKRT